MSKNKRFRKRTRSLIKGLRKHIDDLHAVIAAMPATEQDIVIYGGTATATAEATSSHVSNITYYTEIVPAPPTTSFIPTPNPYDYEDDDYSKPWHDDRDFYSWKDD